MTTKFENHLIEPILRNFREGSFPNNLVYLASFVFDVHENPNSLLSYKMNPKLSKLDTIDPLSYLNPILS